jgi:hypothetical protein
MVSPAELGAVDAFLASPKQLFGSPPDFGASPFVKNGRAELTAVWPLMDDSHVVGAGQLRIVSRPGDDELLSLTVIFARQCVYRVDFVPPAMCESNPPWAAELGLPPMVCGPHVHAWEHNRAHVAVAGWELPAREPLPPQIRRFDQVFPWLTQRINVALTAEQRQFEIPRRLV